MNALELTDEEFRAQCEANTIARMKYSEEREAHLAGVAAKRGKDAAQALRVAVWEIINRKEAT